MLILLVGNAGIGTVKEYDKSVVLGSLKAHRPRKNSTTFIQIPLKKMREVTIVILVTGMPRRN